MTGKPSSFQMDRTITMSLVFTLLVQTSGGLIWAGSAAARLDALENRLAVNTGIAQRLDRRQLKRRGQTDGEARDLALWLERPLIRGLIQIGVRCRGIRALSLIHI